MQLESNAVIVKHKDDNFTVQVLDFPFDVIFESNEQSRVGQYCRDNNYKIVEVISQV